MYMNCVCVRTRTSPVFKVGLTVPEDFYRYGKWLYSDRSGPQTILCVAVLYSM